MANSKRSGRGSPAPIQDLVRRTVEQVGTRGPAAGAAWILGMIVAAVLGVGLWHPLVFGDYALLAPARLQGYGTSWPVSGTPWLSDATFGWWHRIAGREWAWHRVVNMACHGSAVVFVFALGRRLMSEVRPAAVHPGWAALLGAALFALHPAGIHTEAYLAARPLLLQGMFGVVALWAVTRAAGEDWRGVWWLAPTACVGAMLASPAGVGLPLALAFAAYAVMPQPRWGPAWAAVTLSIAVGCVYVVWWTMTAAAPEAYAAAVGDNAWRWLRGLGYAIAPVTPWMALDMPEPDPVALPWLGAVSAGSLVMLLAAATWAVRRPVLRIPGTLAGIAASLSLAEVVFPGAWAGFAPWRSYPWLPLVCLIVAWAIARLPVRAALGAGIAAVALCGVLACFTLQTFATHIGVWDQAIRVAERSGAQQKDARLYVNRAAVHRTEGHTIAALADYDRALALHPDLPRALRGRAQAQIDERRYGAALKDLQRLLEVEPTQPGTHADIGLVLMQMGRYADALKSFNTAVEKGVREPKLFLNRGLALFQLGGLGAAPRTLDDIERALAIDPNYALAHFNRGLIFEQAAQAGMRLRDAVSPEIMRIVSGQNIARACQLGHRPACDLERERAEKKTPQVEEMGEGALRLTPEMLRERGLLKGR